MYPVMLDVNGRRCLVVGGGGVALRKVGGLLAEGAEVTVIAPAPSPEMLELARKGTIRLEERPYRGGEAADYFIVFTATDVRAVNLEVSEDAQAAGLWVNSADEPDLCTFHLPARLERGALQLAIASGGEAPFVVRRLRRLLEQRFGPEWGEWVEAAGRFRRALRDLELPPEEMEIGYEAFFSGTVDAERWTARVPSEAEQTAWLEEARSHRAEPRTGIAAAAGETRPEATEAPRGFVSLVGAGPGDAGLLTLRGRERLMAADVVVYDRLAEAALPCDLPARVELRCVGKQADHHPVPQEEINSLLVRLALQGKRVVRLKGGDPFVFGRGSEEAEDLARQGVRFEIVPCVTAGIAAPAYAGIPVTHRGEAVRLTIVTAHEADKTEGPQVRWDLMAGDPHCTILGYMGVRNIRDIAAKLLAAGMDPKTPAAMIERGTTSRQRVVRSVLVEFADAIHEAGLRPPGLFVIGPTVPHAELLDWFGSRPLMGQRLVIPAPAGELREPLEFAGAQLVVPPLPARPAARIVMRALPLTGCVLKSAAEVEFLDEERGGAAWGEDLVAWCLGAGAAERARSLGWPRVVELKAGVSGAELVSAIVAHLTDGSSNME